MANPYGPPLSNVEGAPGAGADRSLVTITHVIYALHALSLLIGLVGAATIVGSFLFSIPAIIAIVLNYARRSETRGTYLESHFRWQIRTFWFALLWAVVGVITIFILIGFAILGVLAIWLIYRVARGWLALRDERPIQM